MNDIKHFTENQEDGEAPKQGAEENPEKPAAEYAGADGAEAKLKAELEKAKQKDFAEPVIEHLIERCKESESLASDVCQDHKTWEKCFDYIFDQARKQAHGAQTAAVRNDVVYEWAEDYYHLDDKAIEEKKAKEKAERKRKKAEKPLPSQQAGTYKEKKGAEKAEISNKTPVPKQETPKPKPKRNELEGQMDLFSMMGI